MNLELLTIPECPHSDEARRLFRTALDLEGVPGTVRTREISTENEAAELSFHGSPTFRIEGTDVFPSDAEPALTCRVYQTSAGVSGLPSLEDLRQAIRTSLPEDGLPA